MKKIRPSQATLSFLERFSRFGANCIAEFPALHELAQFPNNLWEQMIENKLFGVTIDTELGGQGQTLHSLTKAGMTLVEYGGNIGVAMSWLIHKMVARLHKKKFISHNWQSGKRPRALRFQSPKSELIQNILKQ